MIEVTTSLEYAGEETFLVEAFGSLSFFAAGQAVLTTYFLMTN